jgi:hypothetical protein
MEGQNWKKMKVGKKKMKFEENATKYEMKF